jgi:hypothetical protein
MGSPTYFAVPSRADFQAFSRLCAPAFHQQTHAAFCAWVEEQVAQLQRSGGRAIQVPLDLGDFEHWLQGRPADAVLWRTYAEVRALEGDTSWPPITRPRNIGGESDFIDYLGDDDVPSKEQG